MVDQKFTLVDRRASNTRSEAKATLLMGRPGQHYRAVRNEGASRTPPVFQREGNDLPIQLPRTEEQRIWERSHPFLFVYCSCFFFFLCFDEPAVYPTPSIFSFSPTLDILGRLLP